MATVCSTAAAKEALTVGANPEAMTRGFGGKLYVSMMGETRTEGDGNGGITVIEDGVPKVFCDGMDDPKGIVMLGGFLGIQSAADMIVDEETGMLIVPDTKAGKLFFIGL